jgi:hypothetical protein
MMIRAFLSDYIQWLEGFLRKGGEPTEYIHIPWERFEFMITSTFTPKDEFGARARRVIVSENGRYQPGRIGQNMVYLLSDFSVIGSDPWVPVFANRRFREIPALADFIRAGEAADRELQRKVRQENDAKFPSG